MAEPKPTNLIVKVQDNLSRQGRTIGDSQNHVETLLVHPNFVEHFLLGFSLYC